MGILKAVLVLLDLVSKVMDIFQKKQLEKEAEIRVTSKVRQKVDNAKEKVKKKLADKYPEYIDLK